MPESESNAILSLLAVCGIVSPIFYTVVGITLGLLQQGYNHVTRSMSKLGAVGAPYAVIMNTAGFALLGLLIGAFAFGLDRGISNGNGSKIGPALVVVSGAALVMTAIFPCDPSCVDVSMVEVMHSIYRHDSCLCHDPCSCAYLP